MSRPAFEPGAMFGLQSTPFDDRVEGLYPENSKYHFVHHGVDLWIPCDVPLIPDPSMTELVRVEEDGHSWVEYGREDEGWRRYFGFVRDERRPVSWVRILDVTCPVTGKRTRAIYAHPETIKVIQQVHRVVPNVFNNPV